MDFKTFSSHIDLMKLNLDKDGDFNVGDIQQYVKILKIYYKENINVKNTSEILKELTDKLNLNFPNNKYLFELIDTTRIYLNEFDSGKQSTTYKFLTNLFELKSYCLSNNHQPLGDTDGSQNQHRCFWLFNQS